ncbi:hypothetical protein P7C71_g4322, partial [Lecanoromycetidae sp. Uapishka_2]
MSDTPVPFGSGTYPRANTLADGSIIGVYTAFENGDNVIRTVRSADGGSTWAPLGEVTRGPSNANDIDNPYVLQLPDGRVLCTFRNHSKDPASGAYLTFRITVTVSNDQGVTWAFLSQPASDPGPVNGNWEPFLRNAQDGSIQIYYSRENSAADQDTLMRTSPDGVIWSDAATISGAGIISRDGMTGVAAISGTGPNLMAVFESESDGTFTVMSITSSDDGNTWSNRQTVYTPDSPNTSAGAPQIVNVGGTLGVSFMTNEDESLPAPSGSYTSNTASKLITSGDGGVTWGNKITVGQVQSVWPGLYTLDNSNLLMMFDNGGAKAQKILLN